MDQSHGHDRVASKTSSLVTMMAWYKQPPMITVITRVFMRPATHWDIPIKYWLQCLSVWITDSTLSVSVKLFHYYWLLILELIVIRSGAAVVFDILLWVYCLFCSIADIIAIMFLKTFFVSDPEWQCFVTLWRVSHQNRIILILSIHESYQYTAETGALLDEHQWENGEEWLLGRATALMSRPEQLQPRDLSDKNSWEWRHASHCCLSQSSEWLKLSFDTDCWSWGSSV